MKIFKLLPAFALSLIFLPAFAQTQAPEGFSKGKLVLPDNTVVTGFIKDNIRKDASVTLLSGGTEKVYNGADLNSAETDAASFICIKGDFFKVVCTGELSFLQKSSDASSKPTYNGNEVLFISGTAGKAGDYFIYDNRSRELKLVSKKNLNALIAGTFGEYTPAIDKAKAAEGNIAGLKEAVEVYNGRNGK